MANGGKKALTPQAAKSLVDSVDVFIFDCDGMFSIPSLLSHLNMWTIFKCLLQFN
jgi:hypothetical protein